MGIIFDLTDLPLGLISHHDSLLDPDSTLTSLLNGIRLGDQISEESNKMISECCSHGSTGTGRYRKVRLQGTCTVCTSTYSTLTCGILKLESMNEGGTSMTTPSESSRKVTSFKNYSAAHKLNSVRKRFKFDKCNYLTRYRCMYYGS